MPSRTSLALAGFCCLIAPIGFALGRWSGSTTTPATVASARESPASTARISERAGRPATEPANYSTVAIENLGEVEFDQAFSLLQSVPKEALTVWAKRLEALPVGPRKTAGITAFFKTLAQMDTRTAVDLALSLERYEARWTAVGSIGNATPAANLGEVARMYTALHEKKLGLSDLIINWSRADPAATAEFLAGYEGDVDNKDIEQLMANWAALDSAAASRWLENQVAGRRDEDVYAGFYSGWLEEDRAAALSALRSRASDKTLSKALGTVTMDLFKDLPESAREFVLTLPANAQESAVHSIVHDVTAIYLGGVPDLRASDVAKWLVTLPEELWRDTVGEVVNRWPDEDSVGRDAWIDQLPLDSHDALLVAYCRAGNSYIQAENLKMGLRIRDESLRRKTVRDVFGDMEEQAQQALWRNEQLTPAERKELAKILQ
jgi:hypothetical protein